MKIDYPLLLDGGLSNELERLGYDLNHQLWSARLLSSDPEAIILTHSNYLKAGAQCIITSGYQASIPGFMAAGHDRNGAEALILRTVQLAETAIARFMEGKDIYPRPLIAASIGPYGAYLSDGSEYRGQYGVSDATLREFHKGRIRILEGSNADILACETIPCIREARVLAKLLKESAKPAWISFSCKDGRHINDGTELAKCLEFLADHPNIFALGINCTAPRYMPSLINILKDGTDKKVLIYPNSGEVYDPHTKTWSGMTDPGIFVQSAKEWLSLGAQIIGGCCRIGPAHINSLSKVMS